MIQHRQRVIHIDLGAGQHFAGVRNGRHGRFNQCSHMLIEIAGGQLICCKVFCRQQGLQKILVSGYTFDDQIFKRTLGAPDCICVIGTRI